MTEWDQFILQSLINVGALAFGWLLGSVLADVRGRRRNLFERVRRLESQVETLRLDLRTDSRSYR